MSEYFSRKRLSFAEIWRWRGVYNLPIKIRDEEYQNIGEIREYSSNSVIASIYGSTREFKITATRVIKSSYAKNNSYCALYEELKNIDINDEHHTEVWVSVPTLSFQSGFALELRWGDSVNECLKLALEQLNNKFNK